MEIKSRKDNEFVCVEHDKLNLSLTSISFFLSFCIYDHFRNENIFAK